MSDNMDDFDSDDFSLDDFDDLDSPKNTLGDLWANNIFVKIGAILLGIALLIGVFTIFGGDKEAKQYSSVDARDDLSEVPGGTAEVSENITRAIEDVNTRRLETALRENTSTVPMPTNATKGKIQLDRGPRDDEDPLERWRRLQEDKVDRAVVKKEEDPEPEVDTRTPAIAALSEAMSQQMQSVLGNQDLKGASVKRVANFQYLEGLQEKIDNQLEEDRKAAEETREARGGNNPNGATRTIFLPAGTIEYAQLITEANTDVPGPILAEIMTGPLKGARLIGSFDETYDYLILNFDTIVLDGIDYSIDAVAIDPDTTLPGVVTDINRRYFTRVVLPVAAEFISGFAQAVSESGVTTVTVSGDSTTETVSNSNDSEQEVASGIATAGTELSSIIQEYRDNNPQLLRVRAGTPMGILFTEAVDDEDEDDEDVEIFDPAQRLQAITNSEQ